MTTVIRKAREGNWSAYLQLNPSSYKLRFRASTHDITHVSLFLVDLDLMDSTAHEQWNDWGKRVIWLVNSILGAEYDPAWIHSGRGLQLWYRQEPLIPVTPSNVKQIPWATSALLRKLNEHIEAESNGAWCVDTSCSDLPRLARMPGSINQKTGEPAVILWEGKPSIDFTERLLAWAPPFKEQPVHDGETHSNWIKVFHRLSGLAKDFISEGVPAPGRHKGAYGTAASLRDAGINLEMARLLLQRGALKCSPPLNPEEIEKPLTNAYRV